MSGVHPILVEVERPLGPGVEFEHDAHGGLIGRRARSGSGWLGFDRAALVDSDDGQGRALPVLAALPVSTFTGARLEVELIGGLRSNLGTTLVGRLPGMPLPVPALVRAAAALASEAAWLEPEAAARVVLRARQRYRERRSQARIVGGRAWQAVGVIRPEVARFDTPHSAAEYGLAKLPARFLRGLEGLLDDGERLLYWLERPVAGDLGVFERVRSRIDPRAALLALTDRQLLWIVDHARPDRHLSDWGVDVELIPLERLLEARCAERGRTVELTVATSSGIRTYTLPAELRAEVGVMRDLLGRFVPAAAGYLPRRRYPLDVIPFDAEGAARYGQEAEARTIHASAAGEGEVMAFLFSPRRSGQSRPAALVLRPARVELIQPERHVLTLDRIVAIGLTLSPLVGRISMEPGIEMSYPAPLADRGVAFVRLARRAIANVS